MPALLTEGPLENHDDGSSRQRKRITIDETHQHACRAAVVNHSRPPALRNQEEVTP